MLKNRFNEKEINQISEKINLIETEVEYYNFILYLCIDKRLSVEEIVELYNGSTFDIIKNILITNYNVKFKKCSKCNELRSTTSFTLQSKSSNQLRSHCKFCIGKSRKEYRNNNLIARQKHIDYMKEYNQIYQSENKEQLKQLHHDYYEANKEIILENQKQYYLDNIASHRANCKDYYERNKDKLKKRSRDYKKLHHDEHNQYMKNYTNNRRLIDPMFRLSKYFGTRLWISLKNNKNDQHWEDLVGYTLQDLRQHLESKFDDKMTWDNYGSYWHVDHIVPIAAFTYNSYHDDSFKKCWSLENLQPLCGEDNLLKRDIISEEWNNIELAAQLL
jgi:predicted transcriptional regulator